MLSKLLTPETIPAAFIALFPTLFQYLLSSRTDVIIRSGLVKQLSDEDFARLKDNLDYCTIFLAILVSAAAFSLRLYFFAGNAAVETKLLLTTVALAYWLFLLRYFVIGPASWTHPKQTPWYHRWFWKALPLLIFVSDKAVAYQFGH